MANGWWVAGALVLATQTLMLAILIGRLLPGRTRRPPAVPHLTPRTDTTVTVIVATLNEAHRIGPCLEGLMQQVDPLLEVLVVDSRSNDGTREMVVAAAARDARIHLRTDPPLPAGWIGKVWALETGLTEARGAWVLGIDADTKPLPGLIGAVVSAAELDQYDVVSFSPQFRDQTVAERFVQPAMLVTLVYRCGAVGAVQPPPDRVLANGQCLLARREVLLQNGGFAPARGSFADDVTLVRHLAANGARVGFLDGSRIIQVQGYRSLHEMWREWGRSFDLKDATPRNQRWRDLVLVWSVQALPLPLLSCLLVLARWPALGGGPSTPVAPGLWWALVVVNSAALMLRWSMLLALRQSYAERGVAYWFSWLTDIAAAWRLTISTVTVPTQWRGRDYGKLNAER